MFYFSFSHFWVSCVHLLSKVPSIEFSIILPYLSISVIYHEVSAEQRNIFIYVYEAAFPNTMRPSFRLQHNAKLDLINSSSILMQIACINSSHCSFYLGRVHSCADTDYITASIIKRRNGDDKMFHGEYFQIMLSRDFKLPTQVLA